MYRAPGAARKKRAPAAPAPGVTLPVTMGMSEQMVTYFDGEKTAGLVVAVVGLGALAWAALLRRGGGDLRAMFWPLVIVGAIEAAVGVGLYARTGPQVERLRAELDEAPARFYDAETPRMERVQRAFVVIEVVELALLVAGVALALGFKSRPSVWGVGLGIVLQASVMLVFDLAAERRGALYLAALHARGP